MFKRLFWFFAGFVTAVFLLAKSRAYMKAKTPQSVRGLIFDDNKKPNAARTLGTFIGEFNSARRAQEEKLNNQFTSRMNH